MSVCSTGHKRKTKGPQRWFLLFHHFKDRIFQLDHASFCAILTVYIPSTVFFKKSQLRDHSIRRVSVAGVTHLVDDTNKLRAEEACFFLGLEKGH